MKRISYKCLAEERTVPLVERSYWAVHYDGKRIGHISVPEGTDPSPSIRNWSVVLYDDAFNPLEFPHLDTEDEVLEINEPYVLTNDEKEAEHNLELHSPALMTLNESRIFVRTILERN